MESIKAVHNKSGSSSLGLVAVKDGNLKATI
jgi:hypothetical protein